MNILRRFLRRRQARARLARLDKEWTSEEAPLRPDFPPMTSEDIHTLLGGDEISQTS